MPGQAGSLHLNFFTTMAKVTGIGGKATGKLGSVVYAINRGQQIAREYNGNVANPNTAGQQNTRSKFKLMSQLSSVMAPVLAIRKEGMVSARNLFSKINFPACAYSAGAVSIKLNRVQITKSNVALGGFVADRAGGTSIAVELKNNMAAALDKVVYCLFEQQVTGELLLKGDIVVDVAGEAGKFQGELPMSTGSVAIYAYGIKINESGAEAAFGNMTAPSAESVAKLLVTNSEVQAGTTITATAGLVIREGEDTGDSDAIDQITVTCNVSGNGSVTGAGRYAIGQTVTLTATPDAEASFVGWKVGSASGPTVSTNPVYSFEAAGDVTFFAVFQGGPTPHYTISAACDPVDGGTVSGAGSYEEGATVTLVATPAAGKVFDGWFENATLVSNNATLTFSAQGNRSLVAQFADETESGIISVNMDGSPVTGNQNNLSGAHTFTGVTSADMNGKRVGLTTGSRPTIGNAVDILNGQNATVTNAAFTLEATFNTLGRLNWLVVGTLDSGTNKITIEDFFEYYFQETDE